MEGAAAGDVGVSASARPSRDGVGAGLVAESSGCWGIHSRPKYMTVGMRFSSWEQRVGDKTAKNTRLSC